MVSLSVRSIDYLLASKQLPFRKIGARTMIPVSELQRFARMNHPDCLASQTAHLGGSKNGYLS